MAGARKNSQQAAVPDRPASAKTRGSGRTEEISPETRRILEERARAAARAPSIPEEGERLEVLAFTVADHSYAVETCHVAEVCEPTGLAALPCTPPFIAGVMSLRGQILAVVDLTTFLGMPAMARAATDRIVVLRTPGHEVGLLAESLQGVRSVAVSELDSALPRFIGANERFFKGVTGQMLAVLDGGRLLADDALKVDDKAAAKSPARPAGGIS